MNLPLGTEATFATGAVDTTPKEEFSEEIVNLRLTIGCDVDDELVSTHDANVWTAKRPVFLSTTKCK